MLVLIFFQVIWSVSCMVQDFFCITVDEDVHGIDIMMLNRKYKSCLCIMHYALIDRRLRLKMSVDSITGDVWSCTWHYVDAVTLLTKKVVWCDGVDSWCCMWSSWHHGGWWGLMLRVVDCRVDWKLNVTSFAAGLVDSGALPKRMRHPSIVNILDVLEAALMWEIIRLFVLEYLFIYLHVLEFGERNLCVFIIYAYVIMTEVVMLTAVCMWVSLTEIILHGCVLGLET